MNLKVQHSISLEQLKRTMENLSQGSQLLGQDSNTGPPEHKAEVLITTTQHSFAPMYSSGFTTKVCVYIQQQYEFT
jgi:hypothetical protein